MGETNNAYKKYPSNVLELSATVSTFSAASTSSNLLQPSLSSLPHSTFSNVLQPSLPSLPPIPPREPLVSYSPVLLPVWAGGWCGLVWTGVIASVGRCDCVVVTVIVRVDWLLLLVWRFLIHRCYCQCGPVVSVD